MRKKEKRGDSVFAFLGLNQVYYKLENKICSLWMNSVFPFPLIWRNRKLNGNKDWWPLPVCLPTLLLIIQGWGTWIWREVIILIFVPLVGLTLCFSSVFKDAKLIKKENILMELVNMKEDTALKNEKNIFRADCFILPYIFYAFCLFIFSQCWSLIQIQFCWSLELLWNSNNCRPFYFIQHMVPFC